MERWRVVPSEWWGASFGSIFWPGSHKGESTLSDPELRQSETPLTLASGDGEEMPMDLHSGLTGLKGAVDALQRYEADVGILDITSKPPEPPSPLDRSFDEEEMLLARQRWDEQVEMLLGGVLAQSLSKPLSDVADPEPCHIWDLNGLESPVLKPTIHRRSLSPGLTDSELSVDSDPMPSTPRASKKSYARVLFGERSPSLSPDDAHASVLSPVPSKPLNAAALSFTPMASTSLGFDHRPDVLSSPLHSSDPPFTSPTYEFEFPSLNSNPTFSHARKIAESHPTLEKDENGFYIPVGTPQASARTSTPRRAAALLPAFLAERSSPTRPRPVSRTREMVDRLRSSHRSRRAEGPSRRQSQTALPEQDADGEAEAASEIIDVDGWINSVVNEELAAGDSLVTEDGWIEGPRAQRRSASLTPPSTATSTVFASPSPTATSFGMPCTPQQPAYYVAPFAPPNPAMMQAAYMQMQLQMQQAHAQAQWQAQLGTAHAGALGFYPPYAYPQFQAAHVHGGPVLYEAKAKAGIHAL